MIKKFYDGMATSGGGGYKSYFAKLLPVPGEIKEGDLCRTITNEIGVVINFDGYLGLHIELRDGAMTRKIFNEDIKVAMHLCSRDVKADDKFFFEYSLGGHTSEQVCIGTDDTTVFSEGKNDSLYNAKQKCFKVIGLISPEATWVKQHDEFSEEQIKRDILVKEYDSEAEEHEYTHYHPKGNEVFKLGKYEDFIQESPIRLKCPCCNTFK